MADKVVAVTLRAKIDQYLAAMRTASTATGKLGTDAQASLNQLGGKMQSAGRTMSLGITAPLIAAGGASIHMASQFESAFGQMVGLAGVSADEVDGLKASVLDLAGRTANSPQQLAEALYFLRSSGLDAGEAMDALEQSAMASAAGMGETSVIADAVSSAMNAYAASGLSAAEATDILVATARAGKAEPTELAGALGRVLPIASELGITFEDVGGAIAALSLNGNDASTSATLLTNVMSKLLKPSQQGAQALADVGLSTDSIRQSIAENGLLATLQMLQTRLGDAGFIKFMEDAQAVQGALSLVNDESGNVSAAFDIVKEATGATGQAFSAMSETDAFKMKQGLVDVQTAMVTLGTILLPIAADIAGAVADVAKWFTDLPGPVQKVAVALGAVAAAGGPLLIIGGSLVKNWQSLAGAFKGAGSAAGTATKALGAIGLALGVGVFLYDAFSASSREADARTQAAADAMEGATTRAWEYAAGVEEAGGSVTGLAVASRALSDALTANDPEFAASLGILGEQATNALDVLLELNAVPDFGDSFFGVDPVVKSLERLAQQAGLTALEAHALIAATTPMGAAGHDWEFAWEGVAEILGVTKDEAVAFLEETAPISGAIGNVLDRAKDTEGLQDMASAFLNDAVSASEAGEALVNLAEDQAGASRNGEHAVDVFNALNEILDEMTPAERAAALEAAGLTEETVAAGAAAVDAAVGIEEATDAVGAMEDRAASSIDTMSRYAETFEFAQKLIDAHTEGLKRALGPAGDWIRAHDDFSGSLIGFSENIEDASAGLDYNTEAGLANRDAVFDLADGLVALTQSNIDSGKSTEDTTAEYKKGREALIAAAVAAGLDEDAVNDLITAYGLTPELITTTMNIAGDALNQWRLDRYLEKLDNIDPTIATEIEALIDQGKVDEAIAILNAIPDEVDVDVNVRVMTRHFNVSTSSGTAGFTVGISASAAGRYVDRPMISTLGEHGRREVVLPLEDPHRMANLLAMREVGPLVAAAMPMQPVVNVTAPEGGNTYVTVNNNGKREITRYDIAAAIRSAK